MNRTLQIYYCLLFTIGVAAFFVMAVYVIAGERRDKQRAEMAELKKQGPILPPKGLASPRGLTPTPPPPDELPKQPKHRG